MYVYAHTHAYIIYMYIGIHIHIYVYIYVYVCVFFSFTVKALTHWCIRARRNGLGRWDNRLAKINGRLVVRHKSPTNLLKLCPCARLWANLSIATAGSSVTARQSQWVCPPVASARVQPGDSFLSSLSSRLVPNSLLYGSIFGTPDKPSNTF